MQPMVQSQPRGNPFFTPSNQRPRIIGDPLIGPGGSGGFIGGGPSGNLVGPNSGIFNPSGGFGGGPSFGGSGNINPFGGGLGGIGPLPNPDGLGMQQPDDLNPQLPGQNPNGRFGFGGTGGLGGFGGNLGGGGSGFGGGNNWMGG